MHHRFRTLLLGALLALLSSAPVSAASAVPAEYQAVLTTLGRSGDFKDKVLKVSLPRNDLHVVVEGVAMPTAFGFGGWIAMTHGEGGHDVMKGDLVLLQDEVNPVMSALLDHGLEVTALHNHFFFEHPRIFYMHAHGHGSPADLAGRVKPALDRIGHVPPRESAPAPVAAPPASGTLDTAALARLIGHSGEKNGGVFKVTLGRADLDVREMGAVINARMGLNTWAAFTGSDGRAAIAGDIAMLENEVTPVLQALRAHGLEVVAIHHHMTGSRPMIIFLHYWGQGPAAKLAEGFRAAVSRTGHATP